MPTARGAHAAAVIDGKIHLFGGAYRKLFNLVDTDAHEVYDPATDTWETLSPLPTPRDHLTEPKLTESYSSLWTHRCELSQQPQHQ
jgi:N-acetylneuraminic acid mutarotase